MKFRLHGLMAAVAGLAMAALASAAPPPGWIIAGNAPANYVFAVDTATPISGSKSASITAKPAATSNGFGTLMQMIAADDYRGSRLRLSGYLRTADAGRSQMWMRVDGPNRQVLSFDNMDSRPVTGTTEWKRYDIVLDVPQDSVDIAFGFLLVGRGKLWGADFQLEKVGTAVPVTSGGPILPRKPRNLKFEAAAPRDVRAAANAPFPAIAAGSGRIFVYETTSFGHAPTTEIKLNGKRIGTAAPGRFVFDDQPPGDYTVTAQVPEATGFGGFDGRMHSEVAPSTEHSVTFHVSAGQVRYVSLDVRTSRIFVTQIYPALVDAAAGRAQIEKLESRAESPSGEHEKSSDTSSGGSVVLLSTSASSNSYAFRKTINIFRVLDGGRRKRVASYLIQDPRQHAGTPQVEWLTLEPGTYVIAPGMATYFYQCFQVAPEFRFKLGASQQAYLGDFRLEGLSIHVLNQLDTDAAYFEAHAAGGATADFKLLPMQMKRVLGACTNRRGPPINGYLPPY